MTGRISHLEKVIFPRWLTRRAQHGLFFVCRRCSNAWCIILISVYELLSEYDECTRNNGTYFDWGGDCAWWATPRANWRAWAWAAPQWLLHSCPVQSRGAWSSICDQTWRSRPFSDSWLTSPHSGRVHSQLGVGRPLREWEWRDHPDGRHRCRCCTSHIVRWDTGEKEVKRWCRWLRKCYQSLTILLAGSGRTGPPAPHRRLDRPCSERDSDIWDIWGLLLALVVGFAHLLWSLKISEPTTTLRPLAISMPMPAGLCGLHRRFLSSHGYAHSADYFKLRAILLFGGRG